MPSDLDLEPLQAGGRAVERPPAQPVLKVSIQQPEFMPWLPFFDKLDWSDKFVLLDNVQFERFYFQNRCKIRAGNGSFQLLTIPIRTSSQKTPIDEIDICADDRLLDKNIKTLAHRYGQAPFFKKYFGDVQDILLSHPKLSALNIALIRYFVRELHIRTEILLSSELGASLGKGGSQVIFNITQHLGATEYLSGPMGKAYLDESLFQRRNIRLLYQSYRFIEYSQAGEKAFVPALSLIDLLFNCGDESLEIIRRGKGYDQGTQD